MLPAGSGSLPDSRFFHRNRDRRLVSVKLLSQANVRDDRDISHHADVGRDDGRLNGSLFVAGELEIEVVKPKAVNEVSGGFRFEGSQRAVAQFGIGFPIAACCRHQKFLGKSKDFVAIGIE